ncbi:hypothetical protein CB0940_11557 [Cercospora beticola]|uniref:Uncharacterized protein n=1 Tax=Cercospora beticola TaxID=122368 RepID=A0A2G5HEG2_CERBT|nr:hypothetical protein CB0940_11557 [Cercospora beticola]PIA90895.1 hypothetical protein CB0940_11557 [Cercospora beticola]WPB08428.1 hypothetical protein RHO25_013094 [Cercospora beticola]CAK1367671.1 unnamed protein product [Cercospora beticola]
MNPVGGSGSGSGSGSGQGTGTGKHPASPGECQGSPKRVKPDVDTHNENCFRGAEIEDLLWYTTEKITETYGHDYSRGLDSRQLRKKGWELTNTAQDMNSLCPELEGLEPDWDTLRGRAGDFNRYFPKLQVKAGFGEWETHSSQNELRTSYVNSYSRNYKAFVISSADDQVWKHGIPSGHVPVQAQAEESIRWADIAYYDWAISKNHAGTGFKTKPHPDSTHKISPTPNWFLIQSAAVSPDTKTVTKYCLSLFGIDALPVWPKIITFPTGSYCHRLVLGTASSAEVAQFLITKRWVLGHKVFSSVTIYATSEDKKQEAPNLLWQTAEFHDKLDVMRQSNNEAAFPGTPDGYPHMFKPIPGGQKA